MNLNYFKDRVVAIPFTVVLSMNYGTTDHDLYTNGGLKMKITNSLFIDQN